VRRIVVLSLLAVALPLVQAAPSYAWGAHGGSGFRGHGVSVVGPSRAPSIISVSPRHGMRSEERGPM